MGFRNSSAVNNAFKNTIVTMEMYNFYVGTFLYLLFEIFATWNHN